MDVKKLDQWASEFMGEDPEDAADTVAAGWYTESPGAAFVVLVKAAHEGHAVNLSINGDKATVSCDDSQTSGKPADLGKLIVEACYGCHNKEE